MNELWRHPAESERESDGFLAGLAVGEVTDNKDPDNLARVRVRLPWHAGSGTSFWARAAMPMAGSGRGSYFVPEVGDEVLVAAENGDPSHLYVLGMLWNNKQLPPQNNSDGQNNTRMIKSRSGHTVRFNDDKAEPEVEVGLADGKRILLDQQKITIDDGSSDVITLTASSGTIEIKAAQQLTLRAASVSIEATAAMTVKSSGTLTINGTLVKIN
ncbi:phage baseplate assembly protein V [Streptomyces sp. NPDC016845]|uniref:phage baseplate assembly protein V n=1 Tax=Streptomyces sp. NPDC016845 TaxID=3364972 RepID=UPI0037935E0A